MGDGAVRQHALDVRLHERAEVAHKHRQRREYPERPEPEFVRGGHGRKYPQKKCERRGFRPRGEQRRDRRRRAFVNVRRPHLERRGGYLETQADQDQRQSES